MSRKITNNSRNKGSKQKRDVKPSNPGLTPDTRKDNMDRGRSDFPNDPQWYYGDAILADEISRFSFNQFVGITADELALADELKLPSVMVIPLNPCPGVTPADRGTFRVPEVNSVNGINQALQQWWTVLTSRSGRGAQYSKSDVGMLILSIGELISTIEHLRRVLGVAFTYNLRNRVIPGGLINAMGIDEYDLMSQLADYRLRLNTLIMRLNKIPIPGNIEYFRKCQDLYQKVYVDSISDMAQIYVLVPATTWQINEALSQTGTVLETVSGFFSVKDDGLTGERELIYQTRTFSDYLDELETMIAALMNSSTFSNIYSDMLNAAAQGNISLWSFDLVPEQYSVVPEYNEMMLLMIHNIVPLGKMHIPYTTALTHIDAGTSFATRYDWGTPMNDVFTDPDEDYVVYNPNFVSVWSGIPNTPKLLPPVLMDMLAPNPDVGTRIEVGVYKYGGFNGAGATEFHNNLNISGKVQAFNYCLPDHYAVGIYVFHDVDCTYDISDSTQVRGPWLQGVPGPSDISSNGPRLSYVWSKFQWAPIVFSGSGTDIDSGAAYLCSPVGELNYYTLLNNEWVVHVTDAKYFGLFQIK